MGADRLVSDSFGETRWMGAIENTRGWVLVELADTSFGDFEWKSSGVTAEPEITHKVIQGELLHPTVTNPRQLARISHLCD